MGPVTVVSHQQYEYCVFAAQHAMWTQELHRELNGLEECLEVTEWNEDCVPAMEPLITRPKQRIRIKRI